SADVTFDYGLTTSYGASVIAAESPVTGTSNTSVSYTLAGLSPNTTYHFRVVGQSIAGTTDGDDKTFSTLCVSAVTVQNANDSGPGSLRQAIAAVCDGGLITFAGNYTITLTSQLPAITKTVTIIGNGAANTIIQANDDPGIADYRVFEV